MAVNTEHRDGIWVARMGYAWSRRPWLVTPANYSYVTLPFGQARGRSQRDPQPVRQQAPPVPWCFATGCLWLAFKDCVGIVEKARIVR